MKRRHSLQINLVSNTFLPRWRHLTNHDNEDWKDAQISKFLLFFYTFTTLCISLYFFKTMIMMVIKMKIMAMKMIETAPKSPNLFFTLLPTMENPLSKIWPSLKFCEIKYCNQMSIDKIHTQMICYYSSFWTFWPAYESLNIK